MRKLLRSLSIMSRRDHIIMCFYECDLFCVPFYGITRILSAWLVKALIGFHSEIPRNIHHHFDGPRKTTKFLEF